jgi:hypothetical protein
LGHGPEEKNGREGRTLGLSMVIFCKGVYAGAILKPALARRYGPG